MGIVFAILASLVSGTANVLLKKSFKDFSPSISFFIFAVFSVLLWIPVGMMMGVQFDQWILGSVVGLISAIFGQALYIYVLEKGEISITATILCSFSIYTILFSMIFNGERPTSQTILFIILTIVGTVIVSLPEKIKKNELKKTNYILWAVLTAIGIGISDVIAKNYINRTSAGSFLFYVSFAQIVVAYVYLKIDRKPFNQFKTIFHQLKDYRFSLLGSLFLAVSTMFLFLSFNFTLASIASPIAASSPVITVLLALIFLKDKITTKNWIGLSLVLVSIITIGFINP